MINFSKYCIIIPVYNSDRKLPNLIRKIRHIHKNIFIFVINDGSTDNTVRNIPNLQDVMVFSHIKNFGKGAALLTGFRKAQQKGFQYAICMDADMQHEPENIIDFIESRENSGAELILGVRNFDIRVMPVMRILSNRITTWFIAKRCQKKIHDSQCGFRLIDLDYVNVNDYKYKQFQFESEFLIKALDDNVKYKEISIPTIYSDEKSSINHVYDTFKFIKLYFHSFFWK